MSCSGEEAAMSCLYGIIKEGQTRGLKFLLNAIESECCEANVDPSLDYFLRQCSSTVHLERYLREYSYLFVVENGKVARYSDQLESGQENADKYFEDKLKTYDGPVSFLKFRKHIEEAPSDIKTFISQFYPGTEFASYLLNRPSLFVIGKDDNKVDLVERQAVEFFRGALKDFCLLGRQAGLRFMSLRGRVAQAPEHIMAYVNGCYAGTDFLIFLENNSHVFKLDSNKNVQLVK